MATSSRALVVLYLACSIVVALTQSAGTCCTDSVSFSLGSTSGNTLDYRKTFDGTVSTDGLVSVGYTSSRCGLCATAVYNLRPKSCKYDGSLPTISSFKCSYYLTYLSSDFTDKKETRSKQPCYYASDVSKSVNDTHHEQCSVSYVGVASSVFSLSGPSSVATVSCKGLVASPKICNVYSKSLFP